MNGRSFSMGRSFVFSPSLRYMPIQSLGSSVHYTVITAVSRSHTRVNDSSLAWATFTRSNIGYLINSTFCTSSQGSHSPRAHQPTSSSAVLLTRPVEANRRNFHGVTAPLRETPPAPPRPCSLIRKAVNSRSYLGSDHSHNSSTSDQVVKLHQTWSARIAASYSLDRTGLVLATQATVDSTEPGKITLHRLCFRYKSSFILVSSSQRVIPPRHEAQLGPNPGNRSVGIFLERHSHELLFLC